MTGHHLILGELTDYLTGQTLDDTHDERYRQRLARLLVEERGYRKADIRPRISLPIKAGERRAQVTVDLAINLLQRTGMIIKYGPGSLVTRYRPALAASRLLGPYQVPVVVVTNGEDAHVLDGETGQLMAEGFAAIPSRTELAERCRSAPTVPVTPRQADMAQRILFAFEIIGACNCDPESCPL